MIVLVANRWNPAAESLAQRWAPHGARLLTPADLSLMGWSQSLDNPAAGTIVVGGDSFPQSGLTAVVPLLSCVFEEELAAIVPEDRAYVASEMTAFLIAWLTQLSCLVVNRPTPPCLAGPFWRPERWVHLAARSGVPVQPLRRRAAPGQISAHVDFTAPAIVTVIGSQTFGEAHPGLHRHALTLVRAARVDLAEIQFTHSGPKALFLAAHLMPTLLDPAQADATLALLQGSAPA